MSQLVNMERSFYTKWTVRPRITKREQRARGTRGEEGKHVRRLWIVLALSPSTRPQKQIYQYQTHNKTTATALF